ncbi:hypothetical protein EJD97_007509 [Solanum chilense]|uniref:Uncharacterized protein n=1 Tax=Solanum chilense TaxID=4083 RepID=A0A6N2AHB3_SOLCI|nr:hypothetical protein EJD97_007509 [Solanum chilense]
MVGLSGAIAKKAEKPEDFSMQYVDISTKRRSICAMVGSGAEPNIITKMATERLGMNYVPRNTHLKTINAPQTPMSAVAVGVRITLQKWQGKMNFTVAHLDISDIILG